MLDTPHPIRVKVAAVPTLWGIVVAEQLRGRPETALTLGRFVAGRGPAPALAEAGVHRAAVPMSCR